jgi:hypothetical protein
VCCLLQRPLSRLLLWLLLCLLQSRLAWLLLHASQRQQQLLLLLLLGWLMSRRHLLLWLGPCSVLLLPHLLLLWLWHLLDAGLVRNRLAILT